MKKNTLIPFVIGETEAHNSLCICNMQESDYGLSPSQNLHPVSRISSGQNQDPPNRLTSKHSSWALRKEEGEPQSSIPLHATPPRSIPWLNTSVFYQLACSERITPMYSFLVAGAILWYTLLWNNWQRMTGELSIFLPGTESAGFARNTLYFNAFPLSR